MNKAPSPTPAPASSLANVIEIEVQSVQANVKLQCDLAQHPSHNNPNSFIYVHIISSCVCHSTNELEYSSDTIRSRLPFHLKSN